MLFGWVSFFSPLLSYWSHLAGSQVSITGRVSVSPEGVGVRRRELAGISPSEHDQPLGDVIVTRIAHFLNSSDVAALAIAAVHRKRNFLCPAQPSGLRGLTRSLLPARLEEAASPGLRLQLPRDRPRIYSTRRFTSQLPRFRCRSLAAAATTSEGTVS
jgi:hypothetical protein